MKHMISRAARDFQAVASRWRERLSEEGLDTVESVLTLGRGETVAQSRTSRTLKVPASSCPGGCLFVKVYTFPTARDVYRGLLRGTFLGRARACREWRALELMRNLGIPCAEPVAWGTRRSGPFLRAAYIITASTGPDAFSMDALPVPWWRTPETRSERRLLLAAMAEAVRAMHGKGFTHGDLFFRNIVLSRQESGWSVRFLDCSRGDIRRRTGILTGHALRDLAQMYADASLMISGTDMLRFLHLYMRKGALDSADKQAVRRILSLSRRYDAKERARFAAARLRDGQTGGLPPRAI